MVFSKTFSYALRALLYIAGQNDPKEKVQLAGIAGTLDLPRHFLGKVMNRLVKHKILESTKGPSGGFYFNKKTLKTSLIELVEITGENEEGQSCVLRIGKCNSLQLCPLDKQLESVKKDWNELLNTITIGDLLHKQQPDFIRKSIR